MDFAGFARVLAHFRPVDEDDATTRDPKQPEPLNSRMNKLRCECVGGPALERPQDLTTPGNGPGSSHTPEEGVSLLRT